MTATDPLRSFNILRAGRGRSNNTMAKFTLRFLPVFLTLAFPTQSYSYELFDTWEADVNEMACLMHSASTGDSDAEWRPGERNEYSARIFVVAFHPDAEVPLERVSGVDREPYFISLQAITPSRVDENPPKVVEIVVHIGEQTFQPVPDPTWKQDDLPVAYLGASATQQFIEHLLDGKSPIVTITVDDSKSTNISVSTDGIEQALAKMEACRS